MAEPRPEPGASGADGVDVELPSLRIGVAELRRRPGNRQHVERVVHVGRLETSTAAIAEPGDVELDVTMESLSDGLTVSGVVRVPWTGECRRCLEPTSGVVEADVFEVFQDRPDESEVLPTEGDAVELGPIVHDAAVLALPVAPLCRPDCPGPAPGDFPVRTEPDPDEAVEDPRWAALRELRFDSDPPPG